MYDAKGEKTWEAQLDIYGRVRTFVGRSLSDCPFRYQGQYEDEETGLYYNRFRYYDPSIGSYISQDPIGMLGDDLNLYSYVCDSNDGIDPLGLYNPYGNKKNGHFKKKPGRKPTPKTNVHGNSKLSTKPAVLYAMYDGEGKFQKWGITDKVNEPKAGRYGNSLPEGFDITPMAKGTRGTCLYSQHEIPLYD
jgi:RHS repeat-associated protein